MRGFDSLRLYKNDSIALGGRGDLVSEVKRPGLHRLVRTRDGKVDMQPGDAAGADLDSVAFKALATGVSVGDVNAIHFLPRAAKVATTDRVHVASTSWYMRLRLQAVGRRRGVHRPKPMRVGAHGSPCNGHATFLAPQGFSHTAARRHGYRRVRSGVQQASFHLRAKADLLRRREHAQRLVRAGANNIDDAITATGVI
jgi:hypothetical protein